MPNYRKGTGEAAVPEGPGDPNPVFFDSQGSGANCYAYAINVFRSDAPSINPGEIGNRGHVASYSDSDAEYRQACEDDGLLYVGGTPGTFATRADGYLVAFFMTIADHHWKRCDSQGSWSEKLPGKDVQYCEVQGDQSAASSRVFSFRAYYFVRPGVVKLTAKSSKKSSKCIIL